MKNKTPLPLFNTYIPLKYRIYRTIWPPMFRETICNIILVLAVKIARHYHFNRLGITRNIGHAYDRLSIEEGIFEPVKRLKNPIPVTSLRIAAKVMIMRNLSRSAVINRAGKTFDQLSQEQTHDETSPT